MARYKLKLSKLDFCSIVDEPAQPNAKTLLIKRAKGGDTIEATARVAKIDEELGLAFFWAFTSTNADGTEHFDLQGDNIDTDFIKAAMEFMTDGGGAVDEMHDGVPGAGRVVFAMPMTPEIAKAFGVVTKQSGLMIAIKPTTEVMSKLKDGTYSGVSIAGLGVREAVKSTHVAKAQLYTDEVDGHQHQITCYDDGTFWLSYATATGADNSHNHGVVRGEDGTLVVLADSGHTHELAAGQPSVVIVPADAVVVVQARAPKSTPSIAPPTVRTTTEKSTMANAPDLSKQLDEVTKRAERAERIAKMSGAHKTHFDTLNAEDAELFLAKTASERETIVKAQLEADKPIWTGEVTKVAVRTRDGELALQLAKQNEANAVALAKREDEIEKAEVRSIAKSHLGALAGEDATHDLIVRSLRKSGAKQEDIDKALTAMKGWNALALEKGVAKGGGGTDPTPSEPLAKFNAKLAEFAKSKNKSPAAATSEFLKTTEGAELYDEYSAAQYAEN